MNKTNDIRILALKGWLVIIIGLGALFGWAAFAKLESAAIAYGVIEPLDGIHRIQHLEGGIIKEVHVKDGASVRKGDKLVTLDDTQARVQFDRISQRLKTAQLENHRLRLELEGEEWTLPEALSAEEIENFGPIQQKLFESRQQAFAVQLEIMDQKIIEFENEVAGLNQELQSVQKQTQIFEQRLADLANLMKKNMVTKTEQLELETGLAGYQGKAGRLKANIARIRQQIEETRLKKTQMGPKRLADITAELKSNQELVTDLTERLKAARDILERKAIYSKVSGNVTDLQVKSAGEVLDETSAIMKIVPSDDQMIVRARINPDDIDVVKPGLDVDIRFTAYHRMQPAKGTVTEVSPDRKQSIEGEFFYESIVEMDAESLNLGSGIELYPGMTVQLAIISGERPVWRYLLDPVFDTADRALREQ